MRLHVLQETTLMDDGNTYAGRLRNYKFWAHSFNSSCPENKGTNRLLTILCGNCATSSSAMNDSPPFSRMSDDHVVRAVKVGQKFAFFQVALSFVAFINIYVLDR